MEIREGSPEGKDYSIELNAENAQLELILTEAEKKDDDLAKKRAEAIGEVLECNVSYTDVRAKVDEIKAREESGVRRIPNLVSEKESDEIRSKYEYEILNNLLIKTVEEGKMIKGKNSDKNLLDLVAKKAKALIIARNNTEYSKEKAA